MSSVLQGIKDVGTVNVDPNLEKRIANPPLTVQIYLDYRDSMITADLQYHYGEFKLHPFEQGSQLETNDGPIIIRNFDKEQQVMGFFEENKFQYNGKEMYLEDEQQIFNFLTEQIPTLQKYAQVYYTDQFYNIKTLRRARGRGKISINSDINVLEVGFDFDGIARDELHEVFAAIREKKQYYRLKDGMFLSLQTNDSQDLMRIADLAEALQLKKSDLAQTMLQLPLSKALLFDDLETDSRLDIFEKSHLYTDFVNRVKQPALADFPVPKDLDGVLRSYQKTGYQWFRTLAHFGFGGVLADDMGLGKTIQAISFIVSLQEESDDKQPAIVIAPTSLVYNWQSEFANFAPQLNVLVISGNQSERQQQLEAMAASDVVITSYPLIRRDITCYNQVSFSVCILDEAQFLKNHTTQTAHAVKMLHARNVFALTGTPIENSINDLWSIFDIVLPGYFPSMMAFQRMYANQNHDKLRKRIQPFLLRRLKKDVLQELPPKLEYKQISVLTHDQKKLYLAYLEQIKGEVHDIIRQEGFNRGQIKILAALTRLRQICCHPALFIEDYQGESGKLLQLLEVVSEAISGGHRILIFSQFSSMLKIISEVMRREGYRYYHLDGSTPAAERMKMANQFNEGEADIFLISLKAGGTGLNLTGADTVILYDLWWNPSVEDQATDRAHRIGQTKVVQVIRMISQGTIEEKIYQLQQNKRHLVDSVIQSGEMLLSKLTETEIREILEID